MYSFRRSNYFGRIPCSILRTHRFAEKMRIKFRINKFPMESLLVVFASLYSTAEAGACLLRTEQQETWLSRQPLSSLNVYDRPATIHVN